MTTPPTTAKPTIRVTRSTTTGLYSIGGLTGDQVNDLLSGAYVAANALRSAPVPASRIDRPDVRQADREAAQALNARADRLLSLRELVSLARHKADQKAKA